MFFVFSKCPFLLRYFLSGSHALHLRFIRNKSVTRTLISLIDHLLSSTHPVNVRFPPLHVMCSYSHCVTSRLNMPIARGLSGRGDNFCHRITKFCIH